MPRDYRLMSADGHLEVPPERWIHRVPEKYRDRAPHTVKLPDGGDALMIEGQPLLEANFHEDPALNWLSQFMPNQYCLMKSASVRADHNFSGVVRM